jgi:hypothetical protein
MRIGLFKCSQPIARDDLDKTAGRSASDRTVFDKSVQPKIKLKSVLAKAAGWF